jgi:hypothetical protein
MIQDWFKQREEKLKQEEERLKRKALWFKEHQIYHFNEPLSEEQQLALESLKDYSKQGYKIKLHTAYQVEDKTCCIYLLYPNELNDDELFILNNASRYESIVYMLTVNGNKRTSLMFNLDSVHRYIYFLSKEGQEEAELERLKLEEEERNERKYNNQKHVYKLEKIFSQRSFKKKSSFEFGIVYYYNVESSYGFIVNNKSEEFYFKLRKNEAKELKIQRYSLVEFIPDKKKENRFSAVDIRVLIQDVYPNQPYEQEYRRFGRRKGNVTLFSGRRR